MANYRSIQLFCVLFTASLLLSAVLATEVTSAMTFSVRLTPEAAATLAERIRLIRAVGLALAFGLMLLVAFAASRASRGALAARWLLGVATSAAFLRGCGLVQPLGEHDGLIIAVSAFQVVLEGVAILLLYGEDAEEWFVWRR
ncbi:hypothetical protein OMW55_01740 [Sphingomonas sp. BN140010]|uniref:DUF4345 domain-containing protein n=1 Tax=Sphingomonas arvum TaxID=2992113 RepID=A0ABT3JBX7_9SPHN|nr:hypothetical protein [Sphingomonas sp. BN140010]MCW3796531.1 hypothetical protein [Sphingomonas sp. BN140010]